MPVNTYITANGRIRRRITTNGGAVTDQVAVVTNALGSVVATYKDGWLTADRSYDPYGETRAEWNDVGRFGWVGGLGYRETRREWVSHYVRARHYGFTMGMWTSVDPLWPWEPAFGYVGGAVTEQNDFHGLAPFEMSGGVNPRENPLFCKAFPRLCDWSKPKPAPGPAQPLCLSNPIDWGSLFSSAPKPDCTNPCGQALALGLDRGHGGGVICCGGKKYACAWTRKGTGKAIKKCIREHEYDHFDDVECAPNGSVWRPGWKSGKSPNKEECNAARIEFNCLGRETISCKTAHCQAEIRRRRCQLCSAMQDPKSVYYCPANKLPADCKHCPPRLR